MAFSSEQLALAKQLQSGYVTSGTFHSQNQDTKGGPSQQTAKRTSHSSQPVRSQPPHLRAVNGLVRPLSSTTQTVGSGSMTARPTSFIQSSTARPAPPPAKPAPVSTARPSSSSTSSAPAMHAHASLPIAKSATAQSAQRSAPPVQPVPSANRYTRPPPMPTNLQPAMTPTPLYPTTSAPSKPTASRPLQQSQASLDPQNAELLKTLSLNSAATTGRQNSIRNDAVHKAVMQGIKINQMGKPIVWNWASEEPIAREPTAEEIKEMEEMEKMEKMDEMEGIEETSPVVESKPEPAVAFKPNPAVPFFKPKPAVAVKPKPIVEPTPRKTVGLKGSRHAW